MNAALLPAGYSYEEALQARLDRLLAQGGRSEEIGRSREGRPILAHSWTAPGPQVHKATPSPTPGSRAGILLLSLLHPMEWIGLEANLALLEGWLLPEARGLAGEEGPSLPAGTPIHSIPVANPDGYTRVDESLRLGRPRWVRGNASRIDLNRNFPRGWRFRPPWLDFWPLYKPGPAPLSEPETEAIARHGRRLNLALCLSLHSFGRWIFFPPGYTNQRSPHSLRHQEAIRRALAASQTRYRAGALGRWSPLFRAHGTEIDFLASETDGLAYLVEISRGGFGRWGLRRLRHPFYTFNPPAPELELAELLPVLRRLAVQALPGEKT